MRINKAHQAMMTNPSHPGSHVADHESNTSSKAAAGQCQTISINTGHQIEARHRRCLLKKASLMRWNGLWMNLLGLYGLQWCLHVTEVIHTINQSPRQSINLAVLVTPWCRAWLNDSITHCRSEDIVYQLLNHSPSLEIVMQQAHSDDQCMSWAGV